MSSTFDFKSFWNDLEKLIFQHFGHNGIALKFIEGQNDQFWCVNFWSFILFFFLQKREEVCSGSLKCVVLSISDHFVTIWKYQFFRHFCHNGSAFKILEERNSQFWCVNFFHVLTFFLTKTWKNVISIIEMCSTIDFKSFWVDLEKSIFGHFFEPWKFFLL